MCRGLADGPVENRMRQIPITKEVLGGVGGQILIQILHTISIDIDILFVR